ncbi:MAG: hypothetical protein ACI93S_001365 [Ancylomarina sp.]|jgi:hypothetical protein
MTEGQNSVCVFKGSMIDVHYYVERLREQGIASIIKDEFQSGVHAGVPIGSPDLIELLVDMDNAEKAFECIEGLEESE